MMLRVEWDDEYNRDPKTNKPCKLQGTVTGYIYSYYEPLAVVLQDQRRRLLAINLSKLTPIGWRREYQIT